MRTTTITIFSLLTIVSSAIAQQACDPIELDIVDQDTVQFGTSVAIHSGLIAVGSEFENFRAGSAHIYNSNSGIFEQRLFPHNGSAGDQYGLSVAVSEGWILVAAPQIEGPNGEINEGAVYAYDRDSMTLQHYITPDDEWSSALFGKKIAIDGSTALISDNNLELGYNQYAAYLYDLTSGEQLFKLLPDPNAGLNRFGSDLDLYGNYAVVGAFTASIGAEESGVAYLFNSATGQLLHKLSALNPVNYERLGSSVAIHGSLVAAGALGTEVMGVGGAGSVYLFDAQSGEQIHRLAALDPEIADRFGRAIDCNEKYIVVSAFQTATWFNDAGAVYIFDAKTFKQLAKITPPIERLYYQFGFDVALSDDTLIVSEWATDSRVQNPISKAYRYDLNCTPLCAPDLNDDGSLNFFDISIFLTMLPDYNADDEFNFFDVSEFLADFAAGCP